MASHTKKEHTGLGFDALCELYSQATSTDPLPRPVGGRNLGQEDEELFFTDGENDESGNPTEIPLTEEQLAAVKVKQAELQTTWEANLYKFDREIEYPHWREQFGMLWDAIDAGTLDKTSDFYTKLKKVKDDNPKP